MPVIFGRIMVTDKDREYIQNFWLPRPGHSVQDENGNHVIAEGPLDKDGAQYLLDNGKVGWVQDFKWNPKLPEVLGLFERLGISTAAADSLRWRDHFFPRPVTVEDAIQTLRDVRKMSLEVGDDIITKLSNSDQ